MAGMGMAMGKRPDEQQPMPPGQSAPAPEEQQESPAAETSEPPSHDAAEGEQEAGGGHQEASPQEQAEYEQIMKNALSVIYPPGEGKGEFSPAVLTSLKSTDKPTTALAVTAVSLVTALRDSAQKGGEVDRWNQVAQQGDLLEFDEILYHAGEAIVSELAEIMEATGIAKLSDRDIENAFYAALDLYRSNAEQNGALDKEALKAQWGQLVEADKQGKLDEMLPGAVRHAEASGAHEGGDVPTQPQEAM